MTAWGQIRPVASVGLHDSFALMCRHFTTTIV
jgi:hypothetical protein